MIGLDAEQVIMVHASLLGPHELQGVVHRLTLVAAIDRIDRRIDYSLISDVYHLAACYAAFIAQAHAFTDGNKRTAFAVMDTILALNGIERSFDPHAAGDLILRVVTGDADEEDLAVWLRQH